MHLAPVVIVLVAGIALGATPAWAASGECAELGSILGQCPNIGGELGDDEALLSGDLNGPGSGNGGSGGNSGGTGGTGGGGSSDSPGGSGTHIPGSPRLFEPCVDVFPGYCAGLRPDGPGSPGSPGGPGGVVDPITLSDIEAFRPSPPVQFMQPDGWMVVGLPTNFYAATSAHVVGGELLGLSADVRFTPITYRWRYGDGSTAVLGTRGATWQALGLREFDATATSHIYRASGTYVIDLDVDYTAEYRILGGTWLRIPGTLQLPANRLIATAGSAVTVLVDRDCASAPSGPGC